MLFFSPLLRACPLLLTCLISTATITLCSGQTTDLLSFKADTSLSSAAKFKYDAELSRQIKQKTAVQRQSVIRELKRLDSLLALYPVDSLAGKTNNAVLHTSLDKTEPVTVLLIEYIINIEPDNSVSIDAFSNIRKYAQQGRIRVLQSQSDVDYVWMNNDHIDQLFKPSTPPASKIEEANAWLNKIRLTLNANPSLQVSYSRYLQKEQEEGVGNLPLDKIILYRKQILTQCYALISQSKEK